MRIRAKITRNIFAAVVLLSLVTTTPARADGFSVQKKDYFFATYFEMTHDGDPVGTVVRDRWQWLWRRYEAYDAAGSATFRATSRALGLGNAFAWAAHMTVNTAAGELVGTLDGEFWTSAAARFRIYDAAGKPVALAYVDRSSVGCTVTPLDDPRRWLARFTRSGTANNAPDFWDAKVYDEDAVHPYLLQMLDAMLAD